MMAVKVLITDTRGNTYTPAEGQWPPGTVIGAQVTSWLPSDRETVLVLKVMDELPPDRDGLGREMVREVMAAVRAASRRAARRGDRAASGGS